MFKETSIALIIIIISFFFKFDALFIFLERFLKLGSLLANVNSPLYAVARPSVVCLSSVTFVHPTQAVEILGNISTPFCTLAMPLTSTENFTEIVAGNPSVGGVKHKRGSQI